MDMTKWGGRKFIISLISVIIGTLVEVLTQKGVTPEFAAFLMGIPGLFGLSNVMITNKANSASQESQAQPAPQDNSDVLEKLQDVQSTLNTVAETATNIGQSSANTNKLLTAALSLGVKK